MWLKKYKPEVLDPDASIKVEFETNHMIGDLAYELFPNGLKIPYDSLDFKSLVSLTEMYIEEGIENIYKATFIYNGIVVIVDILHQTTEGLELYEVKSSTDVKPLYLHDVSIQLYVLEALGFKVSTCHVVHINANYIQEKAFENLFVLENVTEEVRALQKVIPKRLAQLEVYLDDKVHEPNIEIGKQCNDPYKCEAKAYCWKSQRNIFDYSILDILSLIIKNNKS